MVEEPLGRAATGRLLATHGIRARRALGQHFLVDPNIVRKIVDLADIGPGERVLEVGAGAGTLTRGLVGTGARVVAYEIDERLRPVLEEVIGESAELRFGDAMAIDPALLDGRWVMVANLPYNVGTPLLLDLLVEAPQIERFVVMLQREAVLRLAASPGTKVYGLPAVVAQLHAEVEVAFRVPPSVFLPVPRVESAVAMLTRQPADPAAPEAIRLATAAFGQRRKMLRRSLAGALADPSGALTDAGVDPRHRAEDLSPADYLRLAGAR